MTLKATSVEAETAFAAEGFCALNYVRRWEITLLTHYIFLGHSVTFFYNA